MTVSGMIGPALRAMAPSVHADPWVAALAAPMQSSGIATPKRIAAFLGQCAVETSGFNCWIEDLRYVTPERIQAIWPTRFPTRDSAVPYIGQPERLANHVYAGNGGNGDEASGDGWRFRGRGLIQITGRVTYTDLAHALNREVEDVAIWLETPIGAATSACWFWTWTHHGALLGLSDRWLIRDISQIVHGCLNDVAARLDASNRALAAISAAPIQVAVRSPTPAR